jgi:glutathione S-transferase
VIMPKPDLTALTGGYRKTPVLQIGADIYCDTALIARVLERIQPAPSLFPDSAPLAPLLAQWADGMLFGPAVVWAMQPAGVAEILGQQPPEVLKAFAADRAAMRGNAPRATLADGTAQLKAQLAALNGQLAHGGPWLLGASPSIADFSVGHCLWFIRRAGPMAQLLNDYPAVGPWLERVLAIGHATCSEMTSAEAIAVAAAAGEHASVAVGPGLGFEAGQAVTMFATDYGSDPVAGALVGLSADEAVLRRTDPRAGAVHVHFPRFGFQLKKDAAS